VCVCEFRVFLVDASTYRHRAKVRVGFRPFPLIYTTNEVVHQEYNDGEHHCHYNLTKYHHSMHYCTCGGTEGRGESVLLLLLGLLGPVRRLKRANLLPVG